MTITSPKMVFSSRYARRDLLSAIEDVGLLTQQGEQYFITNPGFGIIHRSTPIEWLSGNPEG